MAKKISKSSKDNEEEVTFNFSWAKKLFKPHGKRQKHEMPESPGKEEDITLDFSSVSKIFSKYSVLLLILIPLLLSVYIRTIPDQMPIAERWARDSIYNNIKQNLASNILAQYPNLPQQNIQSMVDEQFNTVLAQQQQQIEAAVVQQSQAIRQRFTDDSGYKYLGDIDSYFWLRYAKNIVEKGTYGDVVVDGENLDNHMIAPVGTEAEPNLYPYIEAYLYKFLKIFNPKITLMHAAFYTPLFLSFFAIIAAFLIGKKLAGNLSGLIASILVAVNPTILSRSLGSDNDSVSSVFPLLITLFMLYAFDSKNFKEILIYTVIAGFFVGLYSFAWSGWWFMFLFVLASAVAYIVYIIIFELFAKKSDIVKVVKDRHIMNVLFLVGIFLISTFVFLSLFGNQWRFLDAFFTPVKITQLKTASQGLSIWPNVYTTVAELNEADTGQILNGVGGSFFFWIALMGILLSLINTKEKDIDDMTNLIYLGASGLYYFAFIKFFMVSMNLYLLFFWLLLPFAAGLLLSVVMNYKLNPTHPIMMMIWFMATMYAATKGVRFIVLMVPAFAISFSVFFGLVVEYLSKFISKMLDISKGVSSVILVMMSLIVLIQPIQAGYVTAYNYVPSVNSGWVDTLSKIKAESSADAIINSWWDFGHWFKFFADRAVTFDGASQNKPQAHWIGKVLLTSDEEQAIAILRMLDCGGNSAFHAINAEFNDTHRSVQQIYSVLGKDKTDAEKELRKVLSAEAAEKAMSLLYCSPPEDYFITSADMIGKSGVWAHFGIWDFQKAEIYTYYRTLEYNDFIKTLREQYNYTEDDSKKVFYELNSFTEDRQFNDWIAGWPSYGGSATCKPKGETLECNIPISSSQVIPLQINLTNKEASIAAGDKTYYPNSLGYFEGEKYIIKNYDSNQIGYAVVLMKDNRTILLMSPELVGSMFTRLFYLEGTGLKHFTRFNDVVDISGSRIITWKIGWP